MIRRVTTCILMAALPWVALAEPTAAAKGAPAATAAAAAPEPAAAVPESLRHFMEVKNDRKSQVTIVCLGDSNTEVNWTSRGYLNWVGLLTAGMFESRAIGRTRVINSGLSGDTAKKAVERLDRDVLAFSPDLVIICFGMNDYTRSNPKDMAEALHTIVKRIRAEHPKCSLLLRTSHPPLIPDETNKPVWCMDPEFKAVVDVVRAVAQEENIALVDHFALWTAEGQEQSPPYYCYDMLHANENGHLRLYREIAPVLGLKPELRWMKTKKK